MDKEFLSVIMPVYNEKDTVLDVIGQVLNLGILKELIVVDDGSRDGTRDILKNTRFDPRVKVLFHDRNIGKGGAIQTGVREVSGDVVAIQDADLEYDPEELIQLTDPIQKGVADVVYGSRLWGGKAQRVHMFWHLVGNRLITLVTDILYNTTLTDIETCYKIMTKDVIRRITIRSKGFGVEPELTAKILKLKVRVYEMPISYYGRTYEEGKKITWVHGFEALWTLFKYRFVN
ncbi:MAG: glycosyltransferase family 2 protein [Candidatus Omnitrophica bacterium]|nr:glycosyltransferase family 2 protein [Candidatus Omnitrophota bacterium]